MTTHIVDILMPAITGRLEQQQAAEPIPDIMNMEQCATFLGRSRHSVREFTRRLADPIPSHRPGGDKGDAVYIRSEVMDWLKGQ